MSKLPLSFDWIQFRSVSFQVGLYNTVKLFIEQKNCKSSGNSNFQKINTNFVYLRNSIEQDCQ